MPLKTAWHSPLGLLLLLLAQAGGLAQVAWVPQTGGSPGELAALCRAEKDAYRPLTPDDLRRAREQLQAAADRLDRRLAAGGPNGRDWREFVEFDRLSATLQQERPDTAVLSDVYARLDIGYEALGLVWFVDLKQAVWHYLQVADAIGEPEKTSAGYAAVLDALAERLDPYAARPTPEGAAYIGRGVGWLDEMRQAPKLVEEVHRKFVRPNLWVSVSGDLVAAGIAGPVAETRPVRDVILGTDVVGTGRTTGSTTAELVPNERFAVIDLLMLGKTSTDTIGYNGPARIYTDGTTRIGARKRFWINADGLHAHPAVSRAATDTTIEGIAAVRGGRLVERIACNRAAQQKPLAETIAARHAEAQANAELDRQAAEALEAANRQYRIKLRRPLDERKLFPPMLDFSTTPQAIELVDRQANRDQLAAPGPPPAPPDGVDLSVRLHESAVNNLAEAAVGGMKLRDESLQALLTDLLGEVPESLKPGEESDLAAVRFVRSLPVEITFADGRMTITLRGERYYRGDQSYPGMDVTAVYDLSLSDSGIVATRREGLRIFPPGFVPDGSQKLTARQIAIRTLLERRFGKAFREELRGEGFWMPGRWRKAGKMKPVYLSSRDGWLVVGWKREPEASQEPSADKPS